MFEASFHIIILEAVLVMLALSFRFYVRGRTHRFGSRIHLNLIVPQSRISCVPSDKLLGLSESQCFHL